MGPTRIPAGTARERGASRSSRSGESVARWGLNRGGRGVFVRQATGTGARHGEGAGRGCLRGGKPYRMGGPPAWGPETGWTGRRSAVEPEGERARPQPTTRAAREERRRDATAPPAPGTPPFTGRHGRGRSLERVGERADARARVRMQGDRRGSPRWPAEDVLPSRGAGMMWLRPRTGRAALPGSGRPPQLRCRRPSARPTVSHRGHRDAKRDAL